MTVKELIAELQKCPQDYEVNIFDSKGCMSRLTYNSFVINHIDKKVDLGNL